MKRELTAVLACPLCKDDLELKVGEEDAATAEILSGSLTCVTCGREYQISEGIPDLRPPGND